MSRYASCKIYDFWYGVGVYLYESVMIVYVEGQSCAGKTFIIEALKHKYPCITVVGELPENFSLTSCDVSKLCRDNDIRKVYDAKFSSDR